LWHARTRLGSRPLRALFDLLRGPAAAPGTAGSRWAGMLVCAIDGTCLDVPGSPRCRARYRKGTNQYATAGYPQIRLTALVACGTRATIDAAFGPCTRGETVYGQQLMRCLHANMIVPLDRGFASNAFLDAVAGTSAGFLARLPAARRPPVLHRYRDGSFLSQIDLWGARTASTASGLQFPESAGDLHAARSYSWISPPRIPDAISTGAAPCVPRELSEAAPGRVSGQRLPCVPVAPPHGAGARTHRYVVSPPD
jgi:hypothetical protein